jgi:hypothetical protein
MRPSSARLPRTTAATLRRCRHRCPGPADQRSTPWPGRSDPRCRSSPTRRKRCSGLRTRTTKLGVCLQHGRTILGGATRGRGSNPHATPTTTTRHTGAPIPRRAHPVPRETCRPGRSRSAVSRYPERCGSSLAAAPDPGMCQPPPLEGRDHAHHDGHDFTITTTDALSDRTIEA